MLHLVFKVMGKCLRLFWKGFLPKQFKMRFPKGHGLRETMTVKLFLDH